MISRLTSEMLLRWLTTAAEAHGGDMIRAIILQCIVAANTGHLNGCNNTDARFQDLDDVPPDSERRPISVLALSKSLKNPFETTRRYVNALISEGSRIRASSGAVVPSALLAGPAHTHVTASAAANARRFVRDLARAGVTPD